MKKPFVLLASLLVLSTPAFASEGGKQTPFQKCDFLLSRVIVEFDSASSSWKKNDVGHVSDFTLGTRGSDNEKIEVKIESTKPTPAYGQRVRDLELKPASRLDALIIAAKAVFEPVVVSARVSNTNLVRVKAELQGDSELLDHEKENPRQFTLDDKTRLLSFETRTNDDENSTSLAMTLQSDSRSLSITFQLDSKNYRAHLMSEADSLLFLAGLRLGLPKHLAIQGTQVRYQTTIGIPQDSGVEIKLPDVIHIGSDFIIVGIQQYRAAVTSQGHTEIYLRSKSNDKVFKIVSTTYEAGMMALEKAIMNSSFEVRVIQHEALPGDSQNGVSVNRFEIIGND